MKKIWSILLVAAMTVALAACGSGNAEEKTEQSSSANADMEQQKVQVSAKGELPIVSEPIELDVVIKKNTAISDYENNEFFKYMEEQTGIKVNYKVIPADDITQKVNLMLSSGQEMPDIFLACLPSDLISTYAEKDIFVPLNEYLSSQSAYLEPFLAEREFARKSISMPDGTILGIPQAFPAGDITELASHNTVGGKMWINQNWLDKLHLDMPTTTEEFAAVLRAFKEKDPNGNGLNDEIPMIGANKGGWDSLPEIFLANSFLPYDNDNMYYIDDDGMVQASYAGDAYREALRYLNQLSEEGLIDAVTYTQDNAQLKQLVESEEALVGCFPSAASSMAVTPGTDRFKEYVAVPPLKGPEGVQLTKTRLWSVANKEYTAITTSCENQEAAFKWLDYWFNDEIALWNKYGQKDVHWKTPSEGAIGLNGEPAQIEMIVNLYDGEPRNVRSGTNFGYGERFMNYVQRSEDEYDAERVFMEESKGYLPYIPAEKNYMKVYFYTPEDSKKMSEINGTLISYVDEARTKFIMGTLDINDDSAWESYMTEIEKIGYKTLLDIMQQRKDLAEK